jgi:signal peptidase I
VMLIGAVIALGALTATVHLAPHAGRSTFVIRGASMQPAVPLGALVIVGPARDGYAVGDVVSLRAGGTVVTHRIVGIDTGPDGAPRLTTRGDANDAADAGQAGVSDVIGRVELTLPLAGFALVFLAEPVGIVAVLSFLGTLLMARMFLDDLLAGSARNQPPAAEEATARAGA